MNIIPYTLGFILISFSIIGYGFIFNKSILKINNVDIGYLGLIGIFSLTILAYLANVFTPITEKFNSLIHLLGIIFFLYFLKKNFKLNKSLKLFAILLVISLFFIFTAKTHDDFEYYHFAYIHLLNSEITQIGIGNFNNGFRVPSSIFYFSSLFYLPYLKYNLVHLGSIYFTLFVNFIFLNKILEFKNKYNYKFFVYLSLLGLVISNIFFYRLGEHGTDRSAQILIILLFIEVFYLVNLNNENYNYLLSRIIILTAIVISLKAFYLIYILLIIPVLIYQKDRFLFLKNFFLLKATYFSVFFSFIVLFTYFINSGCFIYPLSLSCTNVTWAIPLNEVNNWNQYYQLWAKAGAAPNFTVNNPEEYIGGLNWLSNWINNYFFNKVSDYLISIFFVAGIFFFYFYNRKNQGINKIKIKWIYIFIILFFIEWFLNHPSLRYGGYHLVALIIFVPLSLYLQRSSLQKKVFYKKLIILIMIIFVISVGRNINRIIKEGEIYNYNAFQNPSYNKNFQNFIIYDQIKESIKCKSNCDKHSVKSKKIFNRNIFYR